MAELLSIKERVEQLLQQIVDRVPGMGTVYRDDMRGMRHPETGLGVDAEGQVLSLKAGDAMIVCGSETVDDGGQGNVGTTIKKLPVQVQVKISQDEDDRRTTTHLHNAWLLAIETAVMANRRLEEDAENVEPGAGGGELLAIDTAVTGTDQGFHETGQREWISAVDFEVTYEHDSNDPAQGPGITHKEV